jgi:hypothetical protein
MNACIISSACARGVVRAKVNSTSGSDDGAPPPTACPSSDAPFQLPPPPVEAVLLPSLPDREVRDDDTVWRGCGRQGSASLQHLQQGNPPTHVIFSFLHCRHTGCRRGVEVWWAAVVVVGAVLPAPARGRRRRSRREPWDGGGPRSSAEEAHGDSAVSSIDLLVNLAGAKARALVLWRVPDHLLGFLFA